MKKTKRTLIITMVNGHIHTMRGWSYDITIEKDCIIHRDVPNFSGVGVHDFVINMSNVLYYEDYKEEVEVNK